MRPDLVFPIVLMVMGFGVLLGLQLRYFAGVALRLAAGEQLKTVSHAELARVVAATAGGKALHQIDQADQLAEVDRLRTTYPKAVAQIALGRRITAIGPFAMAAVLVAWRFWPGLV